MQKVVLAKKNEIFFITIFKQCSFTKFEQCRKCLDMSIALRHFAYPYKELIGKQI